MRISLSIRLLHLFCLLWALAGLYACVMSTGPTEEIEAIEFDDVHALERFVGYYRNRGDAGPDAETEIFLSELIWADRKLSHPSIKFLKVTLERSDALRVTAIREGESLPSEVFVKDRDFVMDKGRISLGSDTEGITGAMVAGVSRTRAWLGIEETGHGVYRRSASVGGLVWVVIPVVGLDRRDVRFEHVATLEALMPAGGGASSALPEPVAAVRNDKLEQEIQRFISVFDSPRHSG